MVSQIEHETILAPRLPLSVLLIEDNPDDVLLCQRALRRAQFEAQVDVVSTCAELVERLQTTPYDVILSDYNLGSWTGMDALEILHHQNCDIPFILITGVLGDQKAVECIKNGATDFILKDRMERLPIAISRAMDERGERLERQRAERLLNESEIKFRALADAIPAAVFIEQGTQCCYANRAAEQITGYSRQELLSMNLWQLILPGSRKALADRVCTNCDHDESPSHYQARILTKKGTVRQLDVTVGMFQIDGGLAALITVTDITEQKGPGHRNLHNAPIFHLPEAPALLRS